jgi:pimeloyl-ACP methyl ester carboxylesterase
VSLLVPLLVAWLVWAAIIFLAQRRMIFPGRSAAPLAEGESLPGARLHLIELPDARVEAWWLPPAEGAARPAPAVIFTHGNMELVDEWVGSFEPLRRAGAGVLLVEYPGYGRSTGVATERSVTAAMVAAYDLLAGMSAEVDPARIVAFGRSVGGGPAAALARERPLAALVLNSSFTGVGALRAPLLRSPPVRAPPLRQRGRRARLPRPGTGAARRAGPHRAVRPRAAARRGRVGRTARTVRVRPQRLPVGPHAR